MNRVTARVNELERLLEALGHEKGIAGFEVNFSCPNVAEGGARYWAVPKRLEHTMKRLRPLTKRALIAKLSPDVTSVPELAMACEEIWLVAPDVGVRPGMRVR